MSNSTTRYSREFKEEAIQLAENIGPSKAASELGVTRKSIDDRIKKLSPESRAKASASGKTVQELEAENRRLRKENEYLNKINDVLKKALRSFRPIKSKVRSDG